MIERWSRDRDGADQRRAEAEMINDRDDKWQRRAEAEKIRENSARKTREKSASRNAGQKRFYIGSTDSRGKSIHAHKRQRHTSSVSNTAHWSGSRARLHNARECTARYTLRTASERRVNSAHCNGGAYRLVLVVHRVYVVTSNRADLLLSCVSLSNFSAPLCNCVAQKKVIDQLCCTIVQHEKLPV